MHQIITRKAKRSKDFKSFVNNFIKIRIFLNINKTNTFYVIKISFGNFTDHKFNYFKVINMEFTKNTKKVLNQCFL